MSGHSADQVIVALFKSVSLPLEAGLALVEVSPQHYLGALVSRSPKKGATLCHTAFKLVFKPPGVGMLSGP